ncbi:MAG: class I SAM-dependent methyltransferase [Chloroflexota bacterium]
MSFEPINLSAYADPVIDELTSGVPKLENSILIDLAKEANGTTLELGCGYGRIAIPLAERGIELVGIELCPPSIAAARQKGAGLPIEWVEGDARTFQLNRKFPFIFARGCVFNFMLTRIDQEAMLARVREHLTEGGKFAFDICYIFPHKMVDRTEEHEWFTMTDTQGRTICFTGIDWYEHDKQLWIQRCWERLGGPTGEPLREPWTLTLRYVMTQELRSLLHYNGFKLINAYMGWDGELAPVEGRGNVFLCEVV